MFFRQTNSWVTFGYLKRKYSVLGIPNGRHPCERETTLQTHFPSFSLQLYKFLRKEQSHAENLHILSKVICNVGHSRELNSGPLAKEARIMPLDQMPFRMIQTTTTSFHNVMAISFVEGCRVGTSENGIKNL